SGQTPEQVEQIREKAINDGNTKKAEKTVKNLLEKAKKADTDQKKSVMIWKIKKLNYI
ncbi:7830_t:CDS:1, partial [Gigaspora margarita]